MPHRWPIAILLLVSVLPPSAPVAVAAPFDGKPKLLLHVSPVVAKNPCAAGVIDCQAAVTSGGLAAGESGPFYDVYLLAAKGNLAATSALSFTLSWDGGRSGPERVGQGIDVFQAVLCEGLCLPLGQPYGQPRGGCNQYWDSEYACRSDDVKVSGYFYLGAYSADTLSVRPPANQESAFIVACPARDVAVPVGDLGVAVFSNGGQVPGCNPCVIDCAVTAVQPGSWSRIKALVPNPPADAPPSARRPR
jgi:hypothetical protein